MAGPRASTLGAATRLLVLGAVRIFQPVHGYLVRRELASWDIGAWASIHPGSIYRALRTLTVRGFLEEASTQASGNRPERTAYRLTPAGESEFFELLRTALEGTQDPTAFLVAVNFAYALPRAEAVSALEVHVADLERAVAAADATAAQILTSDETPNSASEVSRVLSARAAGELTWARDYLQRVRDGAYSFAGEEPDWRPTAAQVAEALAAGGHLPPYLTDAR
jgi:DNA-binding PadR family transcriptional regulator